MFVVVFFILFYSPTIALNHITNENHVYQSIYQYHGFCLDITNYPCSSGFPSNFNSADDALDIYSALSHNINYYQFFVIFLMIWYLYSTLRLSSITSLTKISAVLILFDHPSHARDFILGATTLTRYTMGMAVGYDSANDTILILGGLRVSGSDDNTQQFITFDGVKFEDQGEFYMTSVLQTDGVYGSGQFYSQLGNILWMIKESGTGFVTMDTRTWQVDAPAIDIPTTVSDDGCLASMKNSYNHEYLFVVGGYNGGYLKTVQIYNVSANVWIQSVPSITTKVYGYGSRSCLVYNTTLYAMCGYYGTTQTSDRDNQIHRLNVGNDLVNITTERWKTINQAGYKLGTAVSACRAAVFDDYPYIFVFGGSKACCTSNPTFINVIDTATNTVTWTFGDLVQAVTIPGVVVANNILYAFRGDNWQYLIGPTTAPTSSPSNAPTNPTNNPSSAPTNAPSIAPSNSPTNAPSNTTQSPTNAPSSSPSTAPSNAPSNPPSNAPTAAPVKNPTSAPSYSPTVPPSNAPSSAPSRYPTITNAYDSCINVTFGLQYLSMENIQIITSNAKKVINDIERIIERGFIDQDAILIQYRDFWCKINSVNGNKIDNINETLTDKLDEAQILSMKSVIVCNNAECKHILNKYDEIELESFVTQQLRNYFDENINLSLEFIIISTSDQQICEQGIESDQPSKIPTETPIKSDNSTKFPTLIPTIPMPSTSPITTNPATVFTNSSVTTTTATMIPSISIQSCPIISNTDYIHNLQLIIYYNDNNANFYQDYMSLHTYSITMVNAILLSVQQTASDSIFSAVCDMAICSIFNVDIDQSCTDYEHNDDDIPNRWSYIVFGKFRTNAFKDDVITLMESSAFRYIFTNNMNKLLDEIIGDDELNIEYFESTKVIIFDPTDIDQTSKDTKDDTKDTDNSTTIIIILIICIVLLILIAIGIAIYFKRSHQSHDDIRNKANESVQLTGKNIKTESNNHTPMGDTEGNRANIKAQHITQVSTTQNEEATFIE